MVKWMREHGCPWNKWFILAAAQRDDIEMLDWATENGFPISEELAKEMAAQAAEKGVGKVIPWIESRGMSYPVPMIAEIAMNHSNLPFLKSLFEIQGRGMFPDRPDCRGVRSPQVRTV